MKEFGTEANWLTKHVASLFLAERPDLADSIITVLMSDYKQDVSRNYIFKEPMRAYSYFAYSSIL